jgi:predicted nicotinamide N-methyase
VRANTEPSRPPLVPELQLLLATEIVPIWQQTERELAARGVPPPFWAFSWAGGQALARYLLDHPDAVRGRRVLDFASGSGICAIAAARSGARQATAAEIDAFAGAAIEANAAANGVMVDVRIEDLVGRDEGWEVVLAGDVCYERPMAERVMAWLRQLAARGALVLLGDPDRLYRPREGLVALATYDVPTSRELENRDMRRTGVWRIIPLGATR